MKTLKMLAVLMIVALAVCFGASAQVTNFPDTTVIYTALATPFNGALGWAIGATAVLLLIGWIVRAVRRR